MSIQLRLTLLSLLVCLFPLLVNAQETKDGFIILPDGDYKYGTIQFQPTLNVYEECLFYSETKKQYIKYTPETILGYGVINGIHFITKEIAAGEAQQKHFLKKEIDGLVKLYSYSDNRFFVEKDGFKELKRNDYKAILSGVFAYCKNISPAIKRTGFDLPDLQSVFLRYQRCTDPESASTPSIPIQFDLLAGVELNNTALSGAQTPLNKSDLSLTDKTLISVGANIIFSFKKSKNLSLVTGAYYYQQNFYAANRSVTKDYSSTDKINLDYTELLIPVAVQYSLFKKDKRVMPYLKAGTFIPVTIKSSFVWENEKEYLSTVFFERYDLPQKFKHALPLSVSAGTTFTVFGTIRNVLEISYINGGGELKNSSKTISVGSNRLVVLLGFRF